jgi:hypothetical protein
MATIAAAAATAAPAAACPHDPTRASHPRLLVPQSLRKAHLLQNKLLQHLLLLASMSSAAAAMHCINPTL